MTAARHVRTEVVRCNNCGASEATPIAEGRDHEYATTTDTFRFVRCDRCGLVYLSPRPAVSELGAIYPDGYYAYKLVERRAAAKAGDSLLGRYMTAQMVRRFRPYVDVVKRAHAAPHRILDVGCGDGAILDVWRRAFGEVETHGVEMNEHAAAIARSHGHRVVSARIEDAELPEASFDLACSFHVVEHVEDPAAFLAAIRASLRPDGYALIDTPNVDTFDFRLFSRGHWGGYHFPRHWTLYDAKTFAALADKTGFAIESITYMPSAIFWVWTMHSLLATRSRRAADVLFPPVDIFLRGTPWNVALLSTFTAIDLANIAVTGRCSSMRILLRPR
jgi:2-polyprenyl-3-methyl-5-hydroxy-6-metoxy-1,4-benzoquinol methylase